MSIPWYISDSRFDPGTVADVGYSLRLSLYKPECKTFEWRLYMAVRTQKCNGLEDKLLSPVKVAVFKKCHSLKEAQSRAEEWFLKWRMDLY